MPQTSADESIAPGARTAADAVVRQVREGDMVPTDTPAGGADTVAAANGKKITIPAGQALALCCSGGGIRSATFNLGVVQALQEAEDLFAAVQTVTAVSGGSYIAAAHALVTANPARPADDRPAAYRPAAAAAVPPARARLAGDRARQAAPALPPPAAYALRSPEELHLRDHTRYLLESWQIAVRAIGMLIRGVCVNTILVGSLIFILAHLAGWLIGAKGIGILTGLHVGSPAVSLQLYWLIPVAAAAITVVLAWAQAMPPGLPSRRSRWRRGGRGAAPRPPGERGRLRRALRLIFRDHPARWSNRALACTLAAAFVLAAAPLAIKGLYTVSLGNGNWSVITRFLGFSSGPGCKAAATANAGYQVCGAVHNSPAAAKSNGGGASSPQVLLATFGSVAAVIVTLARATIGRLRTFQADLTAGPLAGVTAKVAAFLQRRLVPWIGSGLIVAGIIVLALRWIGSGANVPPLQGGWTSQAAHCLYALAAFLLVKVAIDINSTSMHSFYRDRLAAAYGVVRRHDEATGRSYARDASWARLSMLRAPGRNLVICAAANCTKGGDLPPGRGCVSFTFTPADIGLSREPRAGDSPPGARAAAAAYEDKARLTLFDAVAVSGAAISPVMGKMTRPAMRILLAAADVRLGVWLDSPEAIQERSGRARARAGRPLAEEGRRRWPWRWRVAAAAPRWLWRAGAAVWRHWLQPDLRHLWAEAAGTLHLDGRWIYVTDGGHYENLGLVEALRREPYHLIVVDASGDAPGQFSTLGQAIALARSELGVQVDIDPADALQPDKDTGLCARPYATGTFSYPDPGKNSAGPHHLIYLKLAVPASAPLDVLAYRQNHTTFPTDSTLQQLYDDQEFEAYRELGYYCAQAVVRDIAYVGGQPLDGAAADADAAVPAVRQPEHAPAGSDAGGG